MIKLPHTPIVHAIAAELYIAGIITGISNLERFAKEGPETIFVPIAMLSLFVLSAALMGFIFLSQPLQLYLDGKKTEAVTFFLKTAGYFALITIVAMSLALFVQ